MTDTIGRKVDVYKNLNQQCISILDREDDRTLYDEIPHCAVAFVRECEFAVQPAGSEKVKETDVKNVHAFVRGTLHLVDEEARVYWNQAVNMFGNDVYHANYFPKKHEAFIITDVVRNDDHGLEEGDIIEEALYVVVTTNGCRVMLRKA